MRFGPFLLVLVSAISSAQQAPEPAKAPPADYAAKREAILAPALNAIQHGDYVAALSVMDPALAAYPLDLRVLFLAADINRIDENFDQALVLYQRCLDLNLSYYAAIHLGRVRVYADQRNWGEFNRERVIVSRLALAGDATLSVDHGYIVEDYRDGPLHVEVLEFPRTDPQAVTRFRFLVTSSRRAAFTPSIDLESNPTDAVSFGHQFAHQAAAHVRPYALAAYPDAHTRVFERFYPDGEPPYEDIRTDVFKLLPSVSSGLPKLIEKPDKHRSAYAPKPPAPK